TTPLNGAAVSVTGVTALDGYAMDDSFASKVSVGDLILAEGFGVAANNGLKVVTATDTGEVLVAGLVDEAAPPATAKLTVVDVEAAAADVDVSVSAGVVTLTSTLLDFTTLGLNPGEWIYLGDDLAANRFANNVGFARVAAIAAGVLTLGKTSWAPPTEAGTGKNIRIYFGTVIRNEDNPALIKRQSLQFERTLGADSVGTMSQYVIGCIANEFTLNVPQAEKITAEMAFVAC